MFKFITVTLFAASVIIEPVQSQAEEPKFLN